MKHASRYNLLGQIPVVGKFFRDFDKNAGEGGAHKAVTDLIKKTETKLNVHGLDKITKEILKNKPVVVVANHYYDSEVLMLIAALPKRDKIFTIVASDLMGMGPNTASYFIPVYIHKHFDKGGFRLSVKIAKLLRLGPRLSSDEALGINIKNINHAASRVKKGALVIIFPEGILKRGSPWLSGVGYLLHAIYKKNNAFYARAYIQGTSHFDILRLIPIVRKLFPPINVYFDRPKEIDLILNEKQNPKEITKNLQEEYNIWVDRTVV